MPTAKGATSSPTLRRPLRVGFLGVGDLDNPNAFSGMPHRMLTLLAPHQRVVQLHIARSLATSDGVGLPAGGEVMARLIPRSMRRRGRSLLSQLIRRWHGSYGRTIAHARWVTEQIQPRVDACGCDVLFAPVASRALFGLRTTIPIVYFTDGTPRLLGDVYPELRRLGRGYARANEEIEQAAISASTISVFPYRRALDSAVSHYRLPRERGRIVPMGAHITPTPEQLASLDPAPPTRGDVRLCIVASNPIRKRLATAVEATEILAQRGYNARLAYIGPPHPAADSPRVDSLGRLMLSQAADRLRHQQTLGGSHFMLLPTEGDGFPIAVCEAAHFGRPTLASDVGGLNEAVLDGQTGVLLPPDASGADYADRIAALVDDPGRYAAMSAAALRYAQSTLTWEAWREGILDILEQAVALRAGAGGEAGGGVGAAGSAAAASAEPEESPRPAAAVLTH